MWTDNMKDIKRVGSRVTCDPAPTDTDEDYLVYTEDLSTLMGDCIEMGFTNEGSYVGSEFHSLRQGTTNLIITTRKEFYDKFVLATHVCKTLNVLDKQDRIVVFQAILYGKEYGKP
jgi:4-hydroxyphenylpyruvate dioxygenase-like putative hemolysin